VLARHAGENKLAVMPLFIAITPSMEVTFDGEEGGEGGGGGPVANSTPPRTSRITPTSPHDFRRRRAGWPARLARMWGLCGCLIQMRRRSCCRLHR
jgi:hypothetical protein